MKSWIRTALYYAAAVIITAAVSVGLTVMIINQQRGDRVVLSLEEYRSLSELAPVGELADMIQQYHPEEELSRQQLLEGALTGMLAVTGDPYATYYSADAYESYLTQLGGKYHGIGALVGQPSAGEAGAAVLKVYANSPAQAGGLQPGDVITAIDGQGLQGLSLTEISQMMEGEIGTTVVLSVERGGQPLSFTLERQSGNTRRVEDGKLFKENTGYIRIDMFTGNCVEEFREALLDLTDRKMRSLVIDLRNNPGGELEKVVAMADLILGEGAIVTVESPNGSKEDYRSDAKGISVPLAVLVNEQSASASEIFAGAIQDNGAGIIVGTATFGKGTVQSTQQLKTNQGWVKMTTASYTLPSGKNIDGTGIQPDIAIDLADELKDVSIDQIEQDDDAQLWAALDEVRAQADAKE